MSRQLYLLLALVAWASTAGADQLDDMTPALLSRLKEVSDVLVPVPKDLLNEALFNVASYYIPIDSETPLCRNHSSWLFDAFLDNQIWALKMVDASSKGGPGSLDGNFMDLGSYGQCLGVTAPGDQFRGQHCVVETRGLLPPEMDFLNPRKAALPVLRTDVMFSVCVPSSCTAHDVKVHMDLTLGSVNASAILYNSSCSHASTEPFTSSDYFAIFILTATFLLVTASTWYENRTAEIEKSPVLTSFSLTLNTKKLLEPEKNSDSLACLNGLRVLAMGWVVIGHRLLHLLFLPSLRMKDFVENMDSFGWAPMQEVQLSVEIFFLMSGLLVTYNFLKDRMKGKHFSYISFVIRRYRRLTPGLAVMVLLYATIIIRFTDGPIWKRIFSHTQGYCQRYWLSTLIYASNYVNPYEICIPQTWYLTVDFQLHVLSPFLLLPLYKNHTKGLLYLGLSFAATTAAALANAYIMELPGTGPFRPDQRRAGDVIPDYVETQYRAGSFLIGVALGWIVFKTKHDQMIIKLSKVKIWLGWLLSVTAMVASIYCITFFLSPDYVYNPWVDTLYHVLHRYTLSVGVAWVILICITGSGGFINSVLSWSAFLPLSRLTYGVYLVHYVVQDIQSLRTRTGVTTDTFTIWYLFFADFFFSYLLAAVLYLAVESPINNVLNHLFSDKPSSTPSTDTLPAYNTPDKDNPMFSSKL